MYVDWRSPWCPIILSGPDRCWDLIGSRPLYNYSGVHRVLQASATPHCLSPSTQELEVNVWPISHLHTDLVSISQWLSGQGTGHTPPGPWDLVTTGGNHQPLVSEEGKLERRDTWHNGCSNDISCWKVTRERRLPAGSYRIDRILIDLSPSITHSIVIWHLDLDIPWS